MRLPLNFGTEKTVETEADSREQATQKPLENITVSISYTAKLTGNNSVGNDWSVSSYCEGNTIVRGKEQTITVPEIFTVECKAVERDNSPDIGYSDIIFSDLIIGFPETKTVTVYVRENRGRYSGNVATWSFTVTVVRLS